MECAQVTARFVRLKASYYRLFHSMTGTDPSSVPVPVLHTMIYVQVARPLHRVHAM